MISKTNHQQKLVTTLVQALTQLNKKSGSSVLLTDQKSFIIVNRLLTKSDLFATGLVKLYKVNNHYESFEKKIILMARITQNFTKNNSHFLNDKEIYLLSTSLTVQQDQIQALRDWPLKKKIKALKQINLDFVPFLQRTFFLGYVQASTIDKISSLTALMTSFEKFYEFQIIYPKTQKWIKGNFIKLLKDNLEKKLKVLQNYRVEQFKQCNQKTKLLILDREIDMISPLVTSLNYGPMLFQMNLLKPIEAFLPNGGSKILNQIFDLDFQQIKESLDRIIYQKIEYRKMQVDLGSFEKAKQIIIKNYDPNSKHQEIQIHIQAVNSIIQYGLKRKQMFILQQNIANGISETGIQLSSRDVTKQIDSWVKEQQKIDLQSQYLKIVVLAFMVYDFWFFNRKQILAAIPKQLRQKVEPFLLKQKGQFKKLAQKKQDPNNRFHFYRHQPRIVKQFIKWFKNQNQGQYESILINKTQRIGQTKYIIYVNGVLGYNQFSYLRNIINNKKQGGKKQQKQIIVDNPEKYILCCDQLMNSKQYLTWLMKEKKN